MLGRKLTEHCITQNSIKKHEQSQTFGPSLFQIYHDNYKQTHLLELQLSSKNYYVPE